MNFLIQLVQKPKLRLRWKLLGGFLAANLLLIAALVLALFTLGGTTRTLNTLEQSSEREVQVDQISIAQEQLMNTALQAAFTGKAARAVEFEIAVDNLKKAVKAFEPQPWQLDTYNALDTELGKLTDLLTQTVQSAGPSSSLPDLISRWNQVSSKQLDTIHSLLTDLIQKERHNGTLAYEQSISETQGTILWISILSGLALLVAVGLAFLLTSALVRPIEELRRSLANLAKGDLTRHITIVNRDELGELGFTFNQTLDSLSELVNILYSQSQKVSTATSELTYQAKSQVAGSEQQAGAIAEAAQAIEELNKAASEIAQQAFKVSESVSHCVQDADQVMVLAEEMANAQDRGRSTVASTISSLFTLKEQIKTINEQQQTLLKQSGVIQRVMELIENIAQTTHLLALNAAIEAAGAGEFGERFGVVAQEVKNLGDESSNATREIREALGNIALTVEEVSSLSAKCLTEAERAVDDSGNSDKVLLELAVLGEKVKAAADSISHEVKGSALLAHNIGASTKQQQAASAQMLEKMLSIDVVTTQNLSSLKQGEVATRDLSLTAFALARSADSFKLNGGENSPALATGSPV